MTFRGAAIWFVACLVGLAIAFVTDMATGWLYRLEGGSAVLAAIDGLIWSAVAWGPFLYVVLKESRSYS